MKCGTEADCALFSRYYIIYVFQGAGLTGRRGNLIADSVQYVLNVVFTSKRIPCYC